MTAVLSFLAGFIFCHVDVYKLTAVRFLIIAAGAVAYNLWLYFRKADREHRRLTVLCSIMGLLTLALMQGTSLVRMQEKITKHTLAWGTAALFLIFAVLCASCLLVEKGITENTVTLIIFAGFLFKLYYAVMTQAHLLQNDIEFLADWSHGHLGYVYRIFSTGRLPTENPIGLYQFYQPPLHYVVSAIFLRIYALLGVEAGQWDEVLQMLPVFYTTAILIFLNKIGIQLHCLALGRCITLGLAAFLPYSMFLGSALNNDPLVTLFMVMCIYFTIKWYQDPKLKTILAMAVCIGCAMMTKLSGAMIAPAMAVVMLYKVWQNRKEWLKWLKQFICFGLVAFPLGLWYYMLRFVQYRVPFDYVPLIPVTDSQFIGMYTKWTRFKDYGHALERLFLRWGPAPDVDYNIPIALVKYSVFNESNYYVFNQMTRLFGTVVFWATAVMLLLFAAAFAGWLFMRRQKMIYKIFLGTGALAIMYSYVKFCFAYPYVCTMNVRYVMTAVYIGMLVLGMAVSGIQEKLTEKNVVLSRIFTGLTVGLTAVYMICSTLLNLHLEIILH